MANPKLRFSKQYPDWKLFQIKDIVEVNPYTAELPERFVYIDLESVDRGDLTVTNILDRRYAPSRAQRLIEKDDVLFQLVRPYQQNNLIYSGLCQLPAVASTGYAQLRPTKTVTCPSFLYTAVHTKTFLENVLCRCTGGTYPAINTSDLSEISLSMPCIEEQQKIAEFFTALDEKIRCLDDLAKGFSQSMQGVLNKVFTQQISFKDENGNNYSEWTIKKIKDVAPLQRGFDLPTSQLQDGECTVIYSNGQTTKHSAFKCDGCAVVTGRSGTIGKVFYLDNCKYWPHNTTLWVTDFCGNNPKFIYYLFKFVGLERFSTGTGVPTLNRNDVHDYVVKIPSIDEQTKIVEFLDCYNKKLNLLISKKHAFHKLKKAFMQRMFV